MDNVKVSVYLNTYNQERYLKIAIESILEQECNFNFEVIVADDCSTDLTQEIAREYKEKYPDIITTFFTPKNVGACQKYVDCLNEGLFKGEYISQIEGDDYWTDKNRLQILVDFLDEHPQYSSVCHNREVVDENGKFTGYELEEKFLDREFTIDDFLEGHKYSSVSSVYRNQSPKVMNRYLPILLASRNVSDFQEMFIAQDFGHVYILNKCLSAYRCRSVVGESNYNSITTTEYRCLDKIHIVREVEKFYKGKYDLTPRIQREQKKLFKEAFNREDVNLFKTACSVTDSKTKNVIISEEVYKALRGKNKQTIMFINKLLSHKERCLLPFRLLKTAAVRLYKKLNNIPYEDNRRGYIISKRRNKA